MSLFKPTISLLLLLGLLPVFQSCESQRAETDIVSVSIAPLKYFVDRLTEEGLEVNVMVPQGSSHGTYSPSARQMQKLSDSGLYLQIGHLGYEQAFIHRLHELNPGMLRLDLSEKTYKIHGDHVCHGDHHHEGGIDPHIWMSPKVMLVLLPHIREALEEVFPHLASVIGSNYEPLYREVESLHIAMEELTSTLGHKRFLIFHPALTYLAHDYGMEQVAIEHEGKEPSAAQLSALIREARAEKIPVIFIQEEYDVRNAQLVAQETGASVEQINPLAYEWVDGMHQLMETFKTHLQ